MVDWTKGFSSRYYVTIVDKDTWRDGRKLQITGGSINRSSTDLRQSADLQVTNYSEIGEQLIRVWLDVSQGSETSHTPLFTGYATSPGRSINGTRESQTLQCYSILKPADDILLPRGWYAPAEVNVIWQIKQLLIPTKSPVKILGNTSDPTKITLKKSIVAEANETHLTMIDALLHVIKWRMTLGGDGTIYLDSAPEKPVATFDSMDRDVVELSISDNYDLYNCPNVFGAIMDNDYAEARDENPKSPLSIQNRGREVWAEESSCNLNENETLAEYARRRLKELQTVNRIVSYDRRYRPEINVTDMIRLNYPAQKITGNFIVTSQGISLGFGGKTSEEVKQV